MRHPSTPHANGQASSPPPPITSTSRNPRTNPTRPHPLEGRPQPAIQEPAITPLYSHHGQHHLGAPSPLPTPQPHAPATTGDNQPAVPAQGIHQPRDLPREEPTPPAPLPQITPPQLPTGRGRSPTSHPLKTTSQHPSSSPTCPPTHQKPPHRRYTPSRTRPGPHLQPIGHVPPSTIDVSGHRPPSTHTRKNQHPLTPHHRSTKDTPQGLKPNPPGRDHRPPPHNPTRSPPVIAGIPRHHRTQHSGTTDHRRERAQTAPTPQQPPPPLHSHQNRPHCLQRPRANPTSTRISLLGHHEQGRCLHGRHRPIPRKIVASHHITAPRTTPNPPLTAPPAPHHLKDEPDDNESRTILLPAMKQRRVGPIDTDSQKPSKPARPKATPRHR